MQWKSHPRIFELNTRPWLKELSMQLHERITLKNIPDHLIDSEFKYFDAIWLMGVWKRSVKSQQIARTHQGLQREYLQVLPDYTDSDVLGSPYAIAEYSIDPHIGGIDGLRSFRQKLQNQNKCLILDFVPNHVALDHPWVANHPDYFVQGTPHALSRDPKTFFTQHNTIFAHGKDPYFDAWTDTVQINPFSPTLRQEIKNFFGFLGENCDGVRCDMAMLVENEVFLRTWNDLAGKPLEKTYWKEIIEFTKGKFPNFKFFAEVYWDMEWDLQQQGFDFCYDKRLYDRLKTSTPESVRAHLTASWEYQSKLVRFIENHDEQRAYHAFPQKIYQSIACLICTLPGAHLIHYGQMRGFQRRLPVQLNRYPKETPNIELTSFYSNLYHFLGPQFGNKGNWKLLDTMDVYQNTPNSQIICHLWHYSEKFLLTLCNLTDQPFTISILVKDLLNFGTRSKIYRKMDEFTPSIQKLPIMIETNQRLIIQIEACASYLGWYSLDKDAVR